jgi:predicted metal-dependent HD superfamily phosphohydrolase
MEREEIEREPSSEIYVRQQWNDVVLPYVHEELHPTAAAILNDTIQAYAEPHRKYHTIDHIADCLQKLEPYKEREDYLQLFLALLWHDDVYDTSPKDKEADSNVEESKDYAILCMHHLGLPGEETVDRLIEVTESHKPETEDEALISDIDMSILAAPAEIYDKYVEGIREEYGSHYSAEQFRAGRRSALKSFGQFYHPDFLHLTEQAESNIGRELLSLEIQYDFETS